MINNIFEKAFLESIKLKKDFLSKNLEHLKAVTEVIVNRLKQNSKILLFGNGGSAADAQHLAAEFVNRLSLKDRPAIPAVALTTDSSILTSISNDFDFTHIFSRQIEALGNQGDIALGISTSGNSQNILNAFQKAHSQNLICIGLLGGDGGKSIQYVDYAIVVNHFSAQRVQEVHLLIEHLICEVAETVLFGEPENG